RLSNESVEHITRRHADLLGIETTDSTIELIVQQLNCDLFYTRAILDAAASRGGALKSFMEFERLYTGEVLGGRIGHYLDALLRDVASDPGDKRAVLEALAFVADAGSEVPIEAVIERMGTSTSDCGALLGRLHSREMLNMSYGFVSAAGDAVLADYVRAKYRSEITGAPKPVAGDEWLSETLKHSDRLNVFI